MRYSKGKVFYLEGDILASNKLCCSLCKKIILYKEKCIFPFYLSENSKLICKSCEKIGLDWRQ